MKICVTGCAGFIGAYVVTCALRAGLSVVGVDNLSADYDVRLKEWRLKRLLSEPGFRFCRTDLTDSSAVRRRMEKALATDGRAGAVIHLAGRVGLRRSLEDPSACYESNVGGTLNLLESCRRIGVPRVVLASTAAVYAEPQGQDALPEMLPDAVGMFGQPSVDSPYAASKRAAEQLIHSYYTTYGIDAVVARLFTVYGPAGHPEMSVFRFVRAISGDEPVEIYGDGTQRRDFTYVEDVARGLVAATRLPGFHVVDLGTGTPIALLKVVDALGAIMGRTPRIRYLPAHPAEVVDRGADVDRTEGILGWVAATPLDAGLRQCVSWFEENRGWVTSLNLGEPYHTERIAPDR
ncbi:MAG: NAD-dependent epimerase/dehydratase family protein [Candidatus Bipolaricaulota bacterium]|nr:NAD-dependent epimerase/dehydratase family protein [Candidatus Bipolaricaulota bacterium]